MAVVKITANEKIFFLKSALICRLADEIRPE
jgi:hypothetical protein